MTWLPDDFSPDSKDAEVDRLRAEIERLRGELRKILNAQKAIFVEIQHGVPEAHVRTEAPRVRVNIGAQTEVEIDKLYGPLVAYGVRVRLDFDNAEWAVCGEFPVYCPAHPDGAPDFCEPCVVLMPEWREMARWSCQ